MEYRLLGRSDLKVSAICLGTMTFGEQNSLAEAHAQLDYAVERGINFIDTAEMYPVPPRGETVTRTETMVGEWLHTKRREDLVVATKVAGPNRSMDWIRSGPKSLDRDNIRMAVEGSLKRLQTDYIDLYQLHWPARNVPMFGRYQFEPDQEVEATSIVAQLQALGELVDEGKIRYVGLSNEHPWGIMQFLQAAERLNLPRVVSIQNAYSLINRTFESGMTEISYREDVPLLAYSPLAFGHLSGKYLLHEMAEGRVKKFPGFGQRYVKPAVAPAVAAYVELANKCAMTPATLALAFVYSRWFVGSTIIGATTMAQLKENIDAWEQPLSDDILSEIDQLQLRFMNPAP
ncbi:MAG: aldo/keto reductase [Zetaproteobacteria bacterium]|nr:aldo/keto reductase [Zetaproteobacteria bacterium]